MSLTAVEQIRRYLRDHAVEIPERDTLPEPADDLQVCVVIPAYDEADRLPDVLDSLRTASRDPQCFEVIVVVNQPADAPEQVRRANRRTLEGLEQCDTAFPLHVVDRARGDRAFPPDAAGVGRARRIAMDLATHRLAAADACEGGLIACVDGDAPVAPGYVDDLLEAFDRGPSDMLAGVCRYRHPIPGDPEHARAMLAYETWMRYFELGLHTVGTPYAYQAIGSCMVLTVRGYALADGVPTREALSDFYLLQKVAKAGGFGAVRQLRAPLVRPSARPSPRVPRGTGPSVRATMRESETRFERVEPPDAFLHVGDWFDRLERGFDDPDLLRQTPEPLGCALDDWGAWSVLERMREHAPDSPRFVRQVHQWFDGLKIVKYCNRLGREQRVWIFDALRSLLEAASHPELAARIPDRGPSDAQLIDRRETLELLRDHELELHTQLSPRPSETTDEST